MNEERTQKCLRQVEHIVVIVTQIFHNGQPGHGGDRKSDDFNLTNKGNNKITELRTILQRESPNS
jgi:hypothetical protein